MFGEFDSDIRISLSLQHFKALVSGNIAQVKVGKETIQIVLQDVGFDQMTKALQDAIANRVVKL